MVKEYCVYAHIKLTDGTPFYVGKGKINRANTNVGRSKWWHRTVAKYGFDVIILEEDLSEKDALQREVYWINRIGRRDLGNGTLVNLTDGGEGFRGKHTDESKAKISINNARGFLGKTHSDETKNKISNANKDNSYAKGHKKTEAGLKKISETSKGNTYMKGKIHSNDTKKKISESKMGKNTKLVYQFDLDGNLLNEYKSLNQAAELNNTKPQMISRVCRGIRNIHKGFVWSYKPD